MANNLMYDFIGKVGEGAWRHAAVTGAIGMKLVSVVRRKIVKRKTRYEHYSYIPAPSLCHQFTQEIKRASTLDAFT